METFRYHPTSCDNNGNFGPAPTDAGWITLIAKDADDAIAQLPTVERDKVSAAMKRYYIDCIGQGSVAGSVSDFIADSGGWGIGFSLFGEEDWACFLDEQE